MKAVLLAMCLTGCATIAAEEASNPFGSHSLVGTNIADDIGCAGTDFTFVQTDQHEGVVQWTTTNADKGFSLAVEGLSLSFGGAGACKLAMTVLDDGTVVRVDFPQSHVSGIAPPFSACSPLVSSCLGDLAVTARSYPYDAFKWLRAKQSANLAKPEAL